MFLILLPHFLVLYIFCCVTYFGILRSKMNDHCDLLNYTSCSSADQLLSIPSQQPDPPKHSTPKKGGEDVGRPVFDQSAIHLDLEGKVSRDSLVSQMMDKQALNISEKDRVCNFLENELQKRMKAKAPAALDAAALRDQQTLDILNKRFVRDDLPLSSCRDTATTAELIAAYRKMPKFDEPRNSRPVSSASEMDLASSSRSKLAFERGKDKLNFYCVPFGDCLTLRLKVWNVDTMQMRLKCEITDETGATRQSNFKIVEVTAPIMEPGGQCEIAVQYQPTKVETNFAHLVLERTNCEHFKKSFQLIGHGGSACVGLSASNYEDGIAKKAASSQAIVLRPDDPNHFWLEFENRGQRPGYVKLVATNRFGKAIPGDQINIKPNQFVLNASGLGGDGKVQKQNLRKVSVRVCDSFDWCGEVSPPRQQLQLMDNIMMAHAKEMPMGTATNGKRRCQSQQQQRRERDSGAATATAGTAGGTATTLATRDSMLSSSSSSASAAAVGVAFRIETHWGEEQQRQRLKCWCWKRKEPRTMNGLDFLGNFEGEMSTSILQREKIAATLTDGEAAEFKNSLRQLTFNVVNAQAKAYFSQLQEDARPLIELYRNQSLLLRETIPGEDSTFMANSPTSGGHLLLG